MKFLLTFISVLSFSTSVFAQDMKGMKFCNGDRCIEFINDDSVVFSGLPDQELNFTTEYFEENSGEHIGWGHFSYFKYLY